MNACDFCLQFERDGSCRQGLKLPKGMSCREFNPSLGKFCSDPKDFVDLRQIVQMATYFGIKGAELKKVKLMATQEESSRLRPDIKPDAEAVSDDSYSPYASFNLRK